jgi:hypothetical protein
MNFETGVIRTSSLSMGAWAVAGWRTSAERQPIAMATSNAFASFGILLLPGIHTRSAGTLDGVAPAAYPSSRADAVKFGVNRRSSFQRLAESVVFQIPAPTPAR